MGAGPPGVIVAEGLRDEFEPMRMVRTFTAERRLRPALGRLPVTAGAHDLLGDQAKWLDRWFEHPQLTDSFWAPLQCGAALERNGQVDTARDDLVPTQYDIGLTAENTSVLLLPISG